jgi:hypothetical protein
MFSRPDCGKLYATTQKATRGQAACGNQLGRLGATKSSSTKRSVRPLAEQQLRPICTEPQIYPLQEGYTHSHLRTAI